MYPFYIIQEEEMRRLIDYTIYRLFWIYQKKDPAPVATTTSLVILVLGAFGMFICILALQIFFGISVHDVIPNGSRTPLLIFMLSVYGVVYWCIKRRYTEKYIKTTLTSKYQSSKYNRRIRGWMLIMTCLLCFFAFTIMTAIIS